MLLDRRPASSGPGTGDLLIASRLEGKVTTWLVAGVSSQLGKSCFLRGMATPPQPHPAPGPAQPRRSQRAAPWGSLARLLPTQHPAGRRPRSPSAQAPAGHPQEALGPAQGWGAAGVQLGQKQNKNPPPALSPHPESSYLFRGLLQSLARSLGAVGKCDATDSGQARPSGPSGPVGRVWFPPGVEGRTRPEVTLPGSGRLVRVLAGPEKGAHLGPSPVAL